MSDSLSLNLVKRHVMSLEQCEQEAAALLLTHYSSPITHYFLTVLCLGGGPKSP